MQHIAFGTYTKTAEPIEMPFGMISGLGPRITVCYVGVTIPERKEAILGESMCPTSLTHLLIANWTGPCSGVHIIGKNA